jgi:hypothetical protein
MAQPTPEVASCLGSGNMSRREEEPGAFHETVQNQDSPSPPRSLPRNFVWRRCPSSASSDDSAVGDMAVDVPVLRECFDPWSHHCQDEAEDGCRGCSKIAKARAAGTRPPHVPIHSECPWPMCLFISIAHNKPPRMHGGPSRSCGTRIRSKLRCIGTEYRPSPAPDTKRHGTCCVLRGMFSMRCHRSGVSPGTWGRASLQGRVLGSS